MAPGWYIGLQFDALKPILRPTTSPQNFSFRSFCPGFLGSLPSPIYGAPVSILLEFGLVYNRFQQICVSIWASFFNQPCITFSFDFVFTNRNPRSPQPHKHQPHKLTHPHHNISARHPQATPGPTPSGIAWTRIGRLLEHPCRPHHNFLSQPVRGMLQRRLASNI